MVEKEGQSTKTARLSSNEMRAVLLDLLSEIDDPEIPVVNIVELGIVRDVITSDPPVVVITPTYMGCPATSFINQSIREKLDENGFSDAVIKQQISPAWSTDWITQEAHDKLRAYGIAPPTANRDMAAICPRCGSENTLLISEFGSTPCKALYKCKDCLEPFDRFKCH